MKKILILLIGLIGPLACTKISAAEVLAADAMFDNVVVLEKTLRNYFDYTYLSNTSLADKNKNFNQNVTIVNLKKIGATGPTGFYIIPKHYTNRDVLKEIATIIGKGIEEIRVVDRGRVIPLNDEKNNIESNSSLMINFNVNSI